MAASKKDEPVIETVTMQDGRTVDFAGKRKLIKTTIVQDGKVQTTLDFRNGQTRIFVVPDNMLHRFAGHGAEQKLGDEIAGLDDVEDCVLAVDELIHRLYNGEWSVKREANGLSGTSVLLRALVEHTGKMPEQIKEFLSKKSPAEKQALRGNAKIKPIVDRLEAEKASRASKMDTEAMLSELA